MSKRSDSQASRGARRSKQKRLHLEQLENRRLLAVLGHFNGDRPRMPGLQVGADLSNQTGIFDSGARGGAGRGAVDLGRTNRTSGGNGDSGNRIARPHHTRIGNGPSPDSSSRHPEPATVPRTRHDKSQRPATPPQGFLASPALPADSFLTNATPAPNAQPPALDFPVSSPNSRPLNTLTGLSSPDLSPRESLDPVALIPSRPSTRIPAPTTRLVQAPTPVADVVVESTTPVATTDTAASVRAVDAPVIRPRATSSRSAVEELPVTLIQSFAGWPDFAAGNSADDTDEAKNGGFSANETRVFGGVISIENQPELQGTLPRPKSGARSLLLLDGSDKDEDDESQEGMNEDSFGLQLFGSDSPDGDADRTETEKGKIVSPESTNRESTSETSVDFEAVANDLAFADYENIDAYGGLVELVDETELGLDLKANPSVEEVFVDGALEVDTIIGQAPLLELEELSAEDVQAADSAAMNRRATSVVGALFAVLPRRVREARRRPGRNSEFLVD